MKHLRVVENFAKGKNYRGSRIFADGQALYSYGRHFALAIRMPETTNKKDKKEWYLLNGDKYSVSTSKHQSITYRVFNAWPRVAFSALHAAGLYPEHGNVNLIDFCKDGFESMSIWDRTFNQDTFDNFKQNMPIGAEYHESKNKDTQEIETKSFHRIGAVILEKEKKYYLCAMDEGSYFISLLPHKVKTVQAGFEALKPKEVKGAEIMDFGRNTVHIDVLRQGEWFFIPSSIKIKEKDFQKSAALPSADSSSNRHICTRLLQIGKKFYCKGIVRHKSARNNRRADHKQVKLGNGKTDIFQAVCNTAKGNWSAGGRVD